MKFLLVFIVLSYFSTFNAMEENTQTTPLQLAEQGHPEPMIELVEQALKEGEYEQTLIWMARYKIRARQDGACYNDPSATKAALGVIESRQYTNPLYEKLDVYLTKKQRLDIYKNQVEWAEQKLKTKELPSPEWIAKYSTDKTENCFVSENEYQQKRQEVLDEFKRQIAEKK